ncbi:inorganic phosphate transporter [Halorarius halobius]|uniref:inorganic phosphate transporter n=1 Tax=Halorarius halobius TaxID=2962671 RepID=UPI0020CD7341|nr:inorganic phosphate transporter [Halorarius halobius]
MSSLLLLVGIAVAAFVGYNVGGATTGVAFGPAVGAGVVSKLVAGVLMAVCFFAGGWTLGRNVVETLGGRIVPAELFTLEVSIGVLFFIGVALLVSNMFGVPASTSMTAVGAIAGLGLATGRLDWAVMGRIVSWWFVAPIIAFWVSAVVGRYFYPAIDRWVAIDRSGGGLFALDQSGAVPRPALGPGTTRREATGAVLVVLIGCYMAFSSGASNTANAVAPLVGSEAVAMEPAILLAGVATGLGAVTIARRTLETVGNDLTDLPITAAIVVAVISATIISALSALGIPASFVVVATMSIVGLGWGRATRTATLPGTVRGEEPAVSLGALDADETPRVGNEADGRGDEAPPIGAEEPEDLPDSDDLFEPHRTARVILMQNLVPSVATAGAYAVFSVLL